jgi:catalase
MKVMQRFLVLSAAAASALVAGCAAGGPPASEPNAARVVGQFQANNGGVHAGYRVNHAKGVCVAGYFEGNGAALPYSRAQLFQKDLRTPVIGRFSIPGGNPQAADGSVPVRGLGLSFMLPDGEQ